MDIRTRVVEAYEEGQNKSEIARRFGISRWTVGRYIKRFEKGELAATAHPGPKPWLDAEQCEVLKEQVKAYQDWTLEQHAEALAVTTGVILKKSAIDKYLRKLGIRYKKRRSMLASEMNLTEPNGGKVSVN